MRMNTNVSDDLDEDIVNAQTPSTYERYDVKPPYWMWQIGGYYNIEPFLVLQIHLFNQKHAKFLITLNGKI